MLCLLLLATAPWPQAAQAQAPTFDIFAPPPPTANVDLDAALRTAGILTGGQTAADLPADQRAAVTAVAQALASPSMGTAVALLSHFPTFAAKENDLFRRTLATAATPAFLMADAAKYDLILQTNKRIHAAEQQAGNADGIAVSLRVGSTGLRFAEWQQWVAQGRPMDGAWTFTNPLNGATKQFVGMPIDPAYLDAKLFAADDDVTNRASRAAQAANPVINERLNGRRAADIFAQVTREEIAKLPDALRAAVRGGGASVPASDMMVEFLSPTQAINVMRSEGLRTAKGWETVIDLRQIHFLGAWVHAEPEKYNGLFAEEQLHAWGKAKGIVTEDVTAPLADGSFKTYRASAETGVLAGITGSDDFPEGVKDPFGWMATNFRQIFVTHAGDLDSVAKYSERMIDWWASVNIGVGALGEQVEAIDGVPAMDRRISQALTPEAQARLRRDFDAAQDSPLVAGLDFDALDTLARAIRNAPNADTKAAAIAAAGGKDAALRQLKLLNTALMLTGQREHLRQLSTGLVAILQEDAAARVLGDRLAAGLTFDAIVAEATARKGANGGRSDDPYISFVTTIDAYANGYANLPPDIAQIMASDIAKFIDSDLLSEAGDRIIDAELRMALLPILQAGTSRARAVGTDIREDAAGLARLADLAQSDLGAAINQKLIDFGEPDLREYLARARDGQITRKKYWYIDGDGGWPRIQEVDQIWRPADIGNDLKRIMWLGQKLGWTDALYAERLAAYFNGPAYRTPSAPIPDDVPTPRGYADMALDAYLNLSRLFERASSTTHFVRMVDPDGNPVTRQITGMNLLDGTIDTGQLVFEQTLRGSQTAAKIWGIKGDLDSVSKFAGSLHSITVGSPDQTDADRARALATMAAEAYGLFPKLVENFGSNDWHQTIDRHVGGSSPLGKAGGTIGAALSNADSAFQTPEAQEALFGAIITDLAVAWQPHLATAMAVHAMYSAGQAYYIDSTSKAEIISLLAQNGNWEFSTAGAAPKLRSLHLGAQLVAEDAAARKKHCVARATSSLTPEGPGLPTGTGVEQALRLMPDLATGVPLCAKIENGTCIPSGQVVKPREAALALFQAAPFNATDPIIVAVKDSINGIVGWTYFDALRRLAFDDGTSWTAERLASHGIFPKTQEDAPFVLRERIEVDGPPATPLPRDTDSQWHVDAWVSLDRGGRKMLGYMASEYWVRRQYLIECVMLDQWLKAAAVQAQKDDLQDLRTGDVAEKLARLDAQMRALDARVWPQIAASHQPYPLRLNGAPYPDDQRLAIYAHYLESTANQRRDLRDIIAWLDGPRAAAAMPNGALSRALISQALVFPGGGTDEMMAHLSANALEKQLELLLIDITEAVNRYETGFDAALARITAMETYVKRGDGYAIAPVHVALMGAGGFIPPGNGFGPVTDHLFPPGPVAERPASFDPIDALLSTADITSLTTGGTVGRALTVWENGYKQVFADARDGVEGKIAPFQTTLVDEKHGLLGQVTPVFSDKTRLFERMVRIEPAQELATAHPLMPRILRQAFQAHKLRLAVAERDRIDSPELAALVAGLTADGNDGTRLQATLPDELVPIGEAFDQSAAALIEAISDLFGMRATVPQTGNIVGTMLRVPEIVATAHTAPGLPVVSRDDIDSWTAGVFWELARAPDFDGPVRPPADDDAITFPPELLGEDETAPVTPPALMLCDAAIPDPEYEARVAVLPSTTKDHGLDVPLISPGVYHLRAVALTASAVPLARTDWKFEVAPAELRGALRVIGKATDIAAGQRVEVHVGGLPWRKLIGTPDQPTSLPPKHPVVTLHRDGLFRAQLCGALSRSLMNGEPVPPALVAAGDAAARIETVGFFYPTPMATSDEQIESTPVSAVAVEPGVLALSEPVRIILNEATGVDISVIAQDASGQDVAPAESRILIGDTRVPGPGPVSQDLAEGDALSAWARMDVLGGSVEATSDPVAFSVADHVDGVALDVALPAYAVGNLSVTGEFRIPDSLQALGGIGGGVMHSNLLPDAGAAVLGDRFAFANADPVALANGLALEALLFANDPDETYLFAAAPRLSNLPSGGALDTGPIDVSVFSPDPVDLTVRLADWTGAGLADPGAVTVTLDGAPMTLTGTTYSAPLAFSGRRDTRDIRVVFSHPATGAVEHTHALSADIVGDPLAPQAPGTIDIRLPIYAAGNLRLAGRTAFSDPRFENERPGGDFEVGLDGQTGIDPWSHTVGEPFLFDLSFPVRVGGRLAVAGRTRIGSTSLKARATGAAPETAGGRPVTLDLGTLVFAPFADLIPMPDLVGMDASRAQAQFGGDFAIQVHRSQPAPTPEEIGIIHAQAPLPDGPGNPSLVPRGLTVTVAAFGDPTSTTVPDVTGMRLGVAQARLGNADIGSTVVPGRRAQDGEPEDLVLAQDPPAGATIDPTASAVRLTVTTTALAQVQPQDRDRPKPPETPPQDPPEEPPEEDPPEEPPEEEPPEEPPAPPPGDTPPPETAPDGPPDQAGDTLFAAGGWVGRLRVDLITFDIREDGLVFDIDCTELEPCLNAWVTSMTRVLQAVVEEERRQEDSSEDDIVIGDIGGAVGDAIVEAMDAAILIGAAFAAVPILEAMFEGVDYGLVVEEREDGEFVITLPDNDGADFLHSVAQRQVTEAGGIRISVDGFDTGEGTLTVIVSLEPTGENSADLSIVLAGRSSTSASTGRMEFSSQMLRGTPDMEPAIPRLVADALAAIEAPPERYLTLYTPLLQLMAELGMDE